MRNPGTVQLLRDELATINQPKYPPFSQRSLRQCRS
jgi:hypothetical protein